MSTTSVNKAQLRELRTIEREEKKLDKLHARIEARRKALEVKEHAALDKLERTLGATLDKLKKRTAKRSRAPRAKTSKKPSKKTGKKASRKKAKTPRGMTGEERRLFVSSVRTYQADGLSKKEAAAKAAKRIEAIRSHEHMAMRTGLATKPKKKSKAKKKGANLNGPRPALTLKEATRGIIAVYYKHPEKGARKKPTKVHLVEGSTPPYARGHEWYVGKNYHGFGSFPGYH